MKVSDIMNTLDLSVGIEIEVTGGGSDALARLWEPLGIDSYAHSYHCNCRSQCSPEFDRPNVVTVQNDCTVEMEFITRPIVLGDSRSWQELEVVGEAFRHARTFADPYRETGQHVHVGVGFDLDALPVRATTLRDRWGDRVTYDGREQLAQFFVPLQETIRPYFAAAVADVREYNHPISREHHYRNRTGWLNLNYGAKTVEFRGWNGSVAPWRWRMAAGISAAMCAAVLDGARPTRKAKPTLAGVLGKHLDSETRELMSRQMFYRLHNY